MTGSVNDGEIQRLRQLSANGSPGPWVAQIEGRNHVSGDTFIQVGGDTRRGTDLYLFHDRTPASAADYELVAAARTSLEHQLDEIDRLRAG